MTSNQNNRPGQPSPRTRVSQMNGRTGAPRPGSGYGRYTSRPIAQKNRLPQDLYRILLIGAIAIALGVFLQIKMPNGFFTRETGKSRMQEVSGTGVFAFSEIMTVNTGTCVDEYGRTPDWVEIENTSSVTQSLAGWSVARDQSGKSVYTFGEVALAPHGRYVLFCDGLGTEGHAPFRLGGSGDTVMLFNAGGTAVDTVNIPALSAGTSYARDMEGTWFVCYRPTPREENTDKGYEKLNSAQPGFSVRINEIVPSNKAAIKAADGNYYDYVELFNVSGEDADLTGCYLSDSMSGKYGWRFPDGTSIGAGQYMIVFCSGLDKTDAAGYIHTDFRLSSGGEEVVLTDASGIPRDSVTYGAMGQNRAWSYIDGEWKVTMPTPGEENK